MAGESARAPRTHLVWSALSTVLCFLPLGVVALAYGIGVRRALDRGDAELAARRSRVALRWLLASVAVGLAVELVIAGGLVVLGALAR